MPKEYIWDRECVAGKHHHHGVRWKMFLKVRNPKAKKKKIRFTFHLSAQTSSLTDFFGYENNKRVVRASVYQRMNDK